MPTTMASLYTGSRHNPPQPIDRRMSMNCVYCKGQHSSSACDVVTEMSGHLAIVKRDKLCYNCLGHHKVMAYNSKFRCRNCKHKHHTTLCTGSSSQTAMGSTNSPINAKANEHSSQTTGLLTPSISELNSPSQASSCLLKTPVAKVSIPNVTMEGNIIFDEGAQRSFITQELAAKLNLQPHGKDNISLASFGSKSSTQRHLNMGVKEIHTLPEEKILMSMLIVPRIAPPIQNSIRTTLKHLPYIMGITLAHPVTDDENFELSILVGADYCSRDHPQYIDYYLSTCEDSY